MKVILKRVGESAVELDADLTLEHMQQAVGGYVQMVPIGPEVEVVCNEEGMFSGPNGGPLAQNAAGFLGDILIVALDSETGEPRSLTEDELRKGFRYLHVLAGVPHPMHSGGPVVETLWGRDAIDKFMRDKTEGTLALWDSL